MYSIFVFDQELKDSCASYFTSTLKVLMLRYEAEVSALVFDTWLDTCVLAV